MTQPECGSYSDACFTAFVRTAHTSCASLVLSTQYPNKTKQNSFKILNLRSSERLRCFPKSPTQYWEARFIPDLLGTSNEVPSIVKCGSGYFLCRTNNTNFSIYYQTLFNYLELINLN